MHSAEPFRNGFKEHVIAVILRDVVFGLNYLHRLGYVHRCVERRGDRWRPVHHGSRLLCFADSHVCVSPLGAFVQSTF